MGELLSSLSVHPSIPYEVGWMAAVERRKENGDLNRKISPTSLRTEKNENKIAHKENHQVSSNHLGLINDGTTVYLDAVSVFKSRS